MLPQTWALLPMCLHDISNSPREQKGTIIDEYTLDIGLIYSFQRDKRQFGERAPLQELGSNQHTGIPPASHFNTAVICRHHYLMKHTAVQEEQGVEFGNKGPAGNLAILAPGISLIHKLPLLLISFSIATSSHIQKHHFNYLNN